MTILVTGAAGFVGSHVARQLVGTGQSVRVLIRPNSNLRLLEGLRAERVSGDLRDASSLERAMKGVQRVFHVAADYRLWARHPEEIYESNVEGTRRLFEIAAREGVERIVYTSTVATMAVPCHGDALPNEETKATLGEMIGHYKRSKFLAEDEARKAAAAGAPIVIVNPTTPAGPGDWKPTPTGRIIVDFLKKKFPAYVETGLNLVDVADVARGHLLAFDKGRIGERYILGGENLTLKQILDTLGAITGLPSPSVKLPYAVAFVSGIFDTFFTGMLMNREPRVTLDSVRMGRKTMWVSSAKAERELGYRAAPVRDALRRAAEWFVAHGYAPAYKKVSQTA